MFQRPPLVPPEQRGRHPDRHRQEPAPLDDLGHRRRPAAHPRRLGQRVEQVDGFFGRQRRKPDGVAGVGVAHPAAGDDDQAAVRLGQQRPDLLRRRGVVQHDQRARAPERRLVERGFPADGGRDLLGRDAELDEQFGERVADARRVDAEGEPVQAREELPVGEPVAEPVGRLDGQPGLADAGRAAHPDRAPPGRGRRLDRGEFRGPAGEPAGPRRQRAGRFAVLRPRGEVAQHRTRFHAQLGEGGASAVEDAQRAHPVAAGDQGAHEQLGVHLAGRVGADERPQPVARRAVVPGFQLQLGQVADGVGQALLREDHLRPADAVDVDVLEERPAPEAGGLAQQLDGPARITRPDLGGLRPQPVEPDGVELRVTDPQQVAGRGRLDGHVGVLHDVAQPLDVAAHHGGLGFPAGPDDLREARGRHRLVRVQEQHDEDEPLLLVTQLHRGAVVPRLERAEHPKLHAASPAPACCPQMTSRNRPKGFRKSAFPARSIHTPLPGCAGEPGA